MNTELSSTVFNGETKQLMRAGFIFSISMAIITIITFAFAMIAIPISGANAPDGGIQYPYLDTLQQFPRDYIWQFSALFLIINYLVQYSIIHSSVRENKKIFTQIGLIFAIMSGLTLLITYFTQVTIVPISLQSNETQGIALITQYNPHGLFIALEELGYILMILSFIALIPVFNIKEKYCKPINIVYGIAVVLVIIALSLISFQYGIDRKDRFEVIIISISWLVLIVNSILLSRLFSKYIKE
jgi:hypothetical protein